MTFLIVYENTWGDVFRAIRYKESKAELLKRFKIENPQYKIIAIRKLKPTLENLYL